MSNFLAVTKRDVLDAYLRAGYPTRYAARMASVHSCTAISARRQLEDAWGSIQCPCGRPSTHQGYCRPRMGLYPGRRQWLAAVWHRSAATGMVPHWPGGHENREQPCAWCGRVTVWTDCYRGSGWTRFYCDRTHRQNHEQKMAERAAVKREAYHTQHEEKQSWQRARIAMQRVSAYLAEPSREA